MATKAVLERLTDQGMRITLARVRFAARLVLYAVRIARCIRVLKTADYDARMKTIGKDLEDACQAMESRARSEAAAQASAITAEVPLRIQVGGASLSLEHWTTVDLDGSDVHMDVRWGLPFADGSASHAYAAHVLEHLEYPREAAAFIADLFRVLMPGGRLRLVVPDMAKYLRAYVVGDRDFFEARSEHWRLPARAVTPLEQVLMYAGAGASTSDFFGHRFGFDQETLCAMLTSAGFRDVTRSEFMQSDDPRLRIDDASEPASVKVRGEYCSLFVEAIRP